MISETKDYISKTYPTPWHMECVETRPTATCHHKSRTWAIIAANGRRVWMTEKNVGAICATMNQIDGLGAK